MTDIDALTRDELTSLCALANGLPIGMAAQEHLDALTADETKAAEVAHAAERERVLQAMISETDEGQAQWAALLQQLDGDASEREDAVAMLEVLVERGAAFGTATLGGIHEDGRCGRPTDGAKAMAIYMRGARAGDFECMYRVGALYERGHGVAKDIFQAMHWYEQAKDRHIFACVALLRLWHKGYGGPAAKAQLAEGHKKMIAIYDYMMSEDTPQDEKPKFDLPVWVMICGYRNEFKDWRA